MRLIILMLLVLLTACAPDTVSTTLQANNQAARTQISELRLTASVQAARAQTTLDFAATRAVLAATQSDFLESTLAAAGTGEPYLQTERARILVSTPTARPTDTAAPTGSGVEPTDVLFTPTPTIPGVTPLVPTVVPTRAVPTASDPDALRLENPRTATGAGNDGCGTNITTNFSTTTPEIYVIVTAYNIEANGATLGARWQRDGETVGPVYTYTPEFDNEELCIWFFVDSSDFPFTAGNYSVTIEIDGVPATQPVNFVIDS